MGKMSKGGRVHKAVDAQSRSGVVVVSNKAAMMATAEGCGGFKSQETQLCDLQCHSCSGSGQNMFQKNSPKRR